MLEFIFDKFLRPEEHYPNVDVPIAQIRLDVEQGRAFSGDVDKSGREEAVIKLDHCTEIRNVQLGCSTNIVVASRSEADPLTDKLFIWVILSSVVQLNIKMRETRIVGFNLKDMIIRPT